MSGDEEFRVDVFSPDDGDGDVTEVVAVELLEYGLVFLLGVISHSCWVFLNVWNRCVVFRYCRVVAWWGWRVYPLGRPSRYMNVSASWFEMRRHLLLQNGR